MQIPILNGIYSDNGPDLRTSYPVNMVPVPVPSGISESFLRPGDGIVANGAGPGTDRGGIFWNGICYRVMGSNLVAIDSAGSVAVLGDVGDDGRLVTMDYSFDLLGVASAGGLYFYDPVVGTVTQNTDPDLGTVVDMCWVDGYWMTTDGEFLVVTDLTNPLAVNPLKYGTSESDPDPVIALIKLRNEVYAINANTIEVFDNLGGDLFPFGRIDGAQIQKGAVGAFACCVFTEQIAFLGGGRNEEPGVYLGANATANKISTDEVDRILATYTEAQLAEVKLEARNDKAHQHLYIHLPDRTLVFDAAASEAAKQYVWFTLTTATAGFEQYRARNLVWGYNKWLVGDPLSSNIGYLDISIGTHWGQKVRWEFGTAIVYNDSKGVLFHELELVSLTGRVAVGVDPQISTSYSLDGQSWSQDKFIAAGTNGNTRKRLVWFRQGAMRNFRMQRFRGDSDAHLSFIRLEARLEPTAF